MRRLTVRTCCLWLHRWVGLAIAGFLLVVGATGSMLAFYDELDGFVNPQLSAPPRTGVASLDLATLVAHAQALAPQAEVTEITLRQIGQADVRVRPPPGVMPQSVLGFDSLLLDPYTGAELGRRTWGDIGQGRINLMPFIYRLHYDLALGDIGMWALGIVALAWTLDCVWSLVLTLPPRQRALPGARRFWARWRPAWGFKHPASTFRRVFDLHRAPSLWLWLVLLGFAWSSVYMNLWDTVYTAVTGSVTEYRPVWTELKPLPTPRERPGMTWRHALARGQTLMAKEAQERGFTVDRAVTLRYEPKHGAWLYRVHSSRDVQDKRGLTEVYFDADSGEPRLFAQPSGQYAGNTVSNWLYALHMANVFGLPWRVFVCVLGLVIGTLSVTGVWIWWTKRKARGKRLSILARQKDVR